MIYIDPPYNTGNDSFIYPDKFSESKDEYLKRIGDLSEEGYLLKEGFFRKNSKDGGHYHSNWLSMMYPRLYIARNLLRDDGVIFVSIDDNEVHNLRMIMNEIFGEENFIGNIIRKTKSTTNDASSGLNIQHENCLIYAKYNANVRIRGDEKNFESYVNPDDDDRGEWVSSDPTATDDGRKTKNTAEIVNPYTGKVDTPGIGRRWRFNEKGFEDLVKEGRIIFKKSHKENERGFILKRFRNELKDDRNLVPTLLIENNFLNQVATKETAILFEEKYFDYPKPVAYINKLVKFATEFSNSDTILDFFAGSGTTAQAVLELNKEDGGNRKFILVQLPEKTDENSEAYKAGYKTIADICKERIRRVIKSLTLSLSKGEGDLFSGSSPDSPPLGETKRGLGFKVFKLSSSNFKHWRSDIIESEEDLEKMIDLFDTQLKPEAKELNMLYELMLKSGLTLTEKIVRHWRKENGFYLIADKLAIVLNKINPSKTGFQKIIDEILEAKPQTCIILDDLFAKNDQLKTNTALQMKDAGVELVTI